uniref:Uncharacterized protein n=1 Tax=Romanomermis culicivorax TaxID=13658 RepID=A0A915HTP7_ROMCU
MTILSRYWFKIRACLLIYIVGTIYTIKQLFWTVKKKVKRPNNLSLGLLSDQDSPLALITGGTKGIGYELAKLLIEKENFSVILLARNRIDGQRAVESLSVLSSPNKRNSTVKFFSVDLTNVDEMKDFVRSIKSEYNKIHLLVNNAGLMMTPFQPIKNEPYEIQWATNVIGTIFLTETLLPLVKRAAIEDNLGRIVNLSSSSMFSHRLTIEYFRSPITAERYSSHEAYGNSKVAIALYTELLQRKLNDENIPALSTYCLHPGVIYTDLYQHLSLPMRLLFGNNVMKNILRSQKDAGYDMMFLCLTESELLTSGAYYENNEKKKMAAVDEEVRLDFAKYVEELRKKFTVDMN